VDDEYQNLSNYFQGEKNSEIHKLILKAKFSGLNNPIFIPELREILKLKESKMNDETKTKMKILLQLVFF
jgi:hypothetical protein